MRPTKLKTVQEGSITLKYQESLYVNNDNRTIILIAVCGSVLHGEDVSYVEHKVGKMKLGYPEF